MTPPTPSRWRNSHGTYHSSLATLRSRFALSSLDPGGTLHWRNLSNQWKRNLIIFQNYLGIRFKLKALRTRVNLITPEFKSSSWGKTLHFWSCSPPLRFTKLNYLPEKTRGDQTWRRPCCSHTGLGSNNNMSNVNKTLTWHSQYTDWFVGLVVCGVSLSL